MKPKIIIMGGPPRSGNFWLGGQIGKSKHIDSKCIGGIREQEKQIDRKLDFSIVEKDTYYFAPHGTFIIDAIMKKKEEGYNITYIHLVRDFNNTVASYIKTGRSVKQAVETRTNFEKEIAKYPQFKTFKYEDFRDNHEQTMRKFFEYIDIPFDEAVLDLRDIPSNENSKFELLPKEQQDEIVTLNRFFIT